MNLADVPIKCIKDEDSRPDIFHCVHNLTKTGKAGEAIYSTYTQLDEDRDSRRGYR